MVGRAQGWSSWGDVELSVLVGLDGLAPSRPYLKTRAWCSGLRRAVDGKSG